MSNQNNPQELLKVTEQIMNNLKNLQIFSPDLEVEDQKKYSFPKMIDERKQIHQEKLENQSESNLKNRAK
jgi:hypothetical protein